MKANTILREAKRKILLLIASLIKETDRKENGDIPGKIEIDLNGDIITEIPVDNSYATDEPSLETRAVETACMDDDGNITFQCSAYPDYSDARDTIKAEDLSIETLAEIADRLEAILTNN